MRLPLSALALLLASALFTACSGDVGTAAATSEAGVSVIPPAATTSRGGAVAFRASVPGDPSLQAAGFSWSVQEAKGGTIDASGRYTAPQTSGTFHVVATNNGDHSKKAHATVTVQSTLVVSVSPKSANVVVGGSTSFTASVTGTNPGDSTGVTWSVQEQGGGDVDASGTYRAPGQTGTFHVVATS